MVVVAQLVRALGCGSRGRRFEPGLPPKEKLSELFGNFFCSFSVVIPAQAGMTENTEKNAHENTP